MASTRLPGKVLLPLAGRPMLSQMMRRLRSCAALDEVVVATTTSPEDDPIAALGVAEGVRGSRGSESDVLGRIADPAREHRADVVGRVTADWPQLDPQVGQRLRVSMHE